MDFQYPYPPIRKISVGSPRNGLNYVVGKPAWNGSRFTISNIIMREDFLEEVKIIAYDVLVENEHEIFPWKTFYASGVVALTEENMSHIESFGVTAVEYELMDNIDEISR